MDEEAWFRDVTDSIEVGESLFQTKLPPLSRGSSFYQYSISFSPLFLVTEEDDPVVKQKAAGAQMHISIISRPLNVLGEHDVTFRDAVFLGETRLKLLIQLINCLKNDSLTLTDFINGVFLLTQNRVYNDEPDSLLGLHSDTDSTVAQNKVELHNHNAYISLRRNREIRTLLKDKLSQSDDTSKSAQLIINQILAEYEYTQSVTKIVHHLGAGIEHPVTQGIQNVILPIYLQGSKGTHQHGRITPGMRIVIDVVKTNLDLVKSLVESMCNTETQASVAISNQTDIMSYRTNRINLSTSTGGLKIGEEESPTDSFFESIFSHQEKIQAHGMAMFTLTSLISIYFLAILSLQRNLRAGDTTNRLYDFLALMTQEESDIRPWLHIYKNLRMLPSQPGSTINTWLSSTDSIPVTLKDLREEILQQIEHIYGIGTTNTLAEFIRLVQQNPETIQQQTIIEQYYNTDCLSSAQTSIDGFTVGIRQPNAVEVQMGLESCMVAALQSFYFLLKDPFDEHTGLVDPFSINGYLKTAKSTYLKEFVELHRLGRGGYGEVVCANRIMENQKYAIKKVVIDINDSHVKGGTPEGFIKHITLIMNEVRILSRLLHPFVVKYYYSWIETVSHAFQKGTEDPCSSLASSGYTAETRDESLDSSLNTAIYTTESTNSTTFNTPKSNQSVKSTERREIDKVIVFVQMEYCSHGSLSKFIQQCNTGMPLSPPLKQGLTLTELLWRMTAQLALAVVYIHSKDIVHYDIKPANIFLDESYNVKLGDFGTSYTCKGPNDNQDLLATDRSTFLYMAPELSAQHWMQNSLNDAAQINLPVTTLRKQADMYSLGMTLLELWFLPSSTDNLSDLRILVQNKQLPSEFTNTHPNVTTLLYQLCDIYPLKRLTAVALVEALSALNLPVISSVLKTMPYDLNSLSNNRISTILNFLEYNDDHISQEDRYMLISFLVKDNYCAELSLLSQFKEINNMKILQSLQILPENSQDCYPTDAVGIRSQNTSFTRKKHTVLNVENKITYRSLNTYLEVSGIDSFIEHIILLMGCVPIVLPSTTPYISLRADVQQYASTCDCNILLSTPLTQQLFTSMSEIYQKKQKPNNGSMSYDNNETSLSTTTTVKMSDNSLFDQLTIIPEKTQAGTNISEDTSTIDFSSTLLIDLTKSISLAFQVFLSSPLSSVTDQKKYYPTHTTMLDLKNNAQHHNSHEVNNIMLSDDIKSYFARHMRYDGEQCITAFRKVMSITTTRNTNLVARSRLRAIEWSLTILRVIFEVINQHVTYHTVHTRATDRRTGKIGKIIDTLSINITICFVKGDPLNKEQFRLTGERPNTLKFYNLSHIDNIVFFQSLETINSCGIISTSVLLLEYLKTSAFADRIWVKFTPSEKYFFGANSISFACYRRDTDAGYNQSICTNIGKSNRVDGYYSNKRAFMHTTVDGVLYDGPSMEKETTLQKCGIEVLLTGSFLITNPAEYNINQLFCMQLIPCDFVSLSFSPRIIQTIIKQYKQDCNIYPVVKYCNPTGLVAQVYSCYNDDAFLEEKIAILARTILIEKMLLLYGFHVIPRDSENDNLLQSNCVYVTVDKTQFDFLLGGTKGTHYIIDFSLCPESSMIDSIGRFICSLEEHFISDLHI